jgi:hypothetical protein
LGAGSAAVGRRRQRESRLRRARCGGLVALVRAGGVVKTRAAAARPLPAPPAAAVVFCQSSVEPANCAANEDSLHRRNAMTFEMNFTRTTGTSSSPLQSRGPRS